MQRYFWHAMRTRSRRRQAPRRQNRLRFETLEARQLLAGDGLLITELMASNNATLADEEGDYPDWLEIYNPGDETVQLEHWSLTDDADVPIQWEFPAVTLDAGDYLVVFASGKDRTVPGATLHTNFRLDVDGEYLALTAPDGVTIAHAYAPSYPPQTTDRSYGIDPDNLEAGAFYFATPTPGAVNSVATVQQVVHFSHPGGTFVEPFELILSGATAEEMIAYTTDGSVPGPAAHVYGGPITIDGTVEIRTRIRQPGLVDGPVTTAGFSHLGADVADFRSQLPIMLIDNFGGGTIPNKGWNQTGTGIRQVPRQAARLSFFDTTGGDASSLADSPALDSRIGIRVRGAFSSSFPEPGYSVEAWNETDDDTDIAPLGMAPESDWVLYAPNPQHDYSLMHNSFLFELSREIGHWAPEIQYVEAFLNTDGGDVTMADYVGLYVMTEKVKRDPGRLDFERLASDGSSGGWLLNINRMDPTSEDGQSAPQYFHTAGPNGSQETPPNTAGRGDDIPRQYNAFINFDDPNGYKIKPTQRAAIEGWFREMEDVLYGRAAGVAWDDPVDGYARYIDVDDFIDYFILHNLSRNGDGLLLSMWLYNPDPAGNGKLHMGPPWDNDLGAFSGSATSDLLRRSDRLWYGRMFQDPNFMQRYVDRWQELRQGPLADANLAAIVDRLVAEIGNDAARRDGVNDWANRTNRMKGWLDARAAAIDAQYISPVDFNHDGGPVDSGFELVMTAPTGAIYYTVDGSDPRLPGGQINPAALLFDSGTTRTTLLPAGALWNYLDDGSNQGTAWYASAFDDHLWQRGAAEFGYGDGREETTLSYGGNASNKFITSYFRTTVDIADPSQYDSLTLRLQRDDGAVVYFNGGELLRSNMPSSAGQPLGYLTEAAGSVGGSSETTFFEFQVDPAMLVDGENLIAVEIHQHAPTSSDLAFDLELVGNTIAVSTPLVMERTTRVQARARSGTKWSGITEALLLVDSVPASADNVRITEVNYHPHPPLTQFGEDPLDAEAFEFIELANVGPTRINLAGMRFVRGVDFTFGNLELDPGARTVVVKNRQAFASRYGQDVNVAGQLAAGNLANDGETLTLVDAAGDLITELTYNDTGAWPGRADGKGASLELVDPAGDSADPDSWRGSSEIGGSPGKEGAGPVDEVLINEVLSRSEGAAGDRIELVNRSAQRIDLSHWYLSDNGLDGLEYALPNGTQLDPGAYLVLDQTEFTFPLSGQFGDELTLIEADSASGRPVRFADQVQFDASSPGVSLGRWPNADPVAALFPMQGQTFGAANDGPALGPVIISELNYQPAPAGPGSAIDPDPLEFVEVYNRSGTSLVLGGWRIDGFGFTFPGDTTLPPAGTMVVVTFDPTTDAARAAEFRSFYSLDQSVALLGPAGGRLRDSGETIKLMRPDQPGAVTGYVVVDQVRYDRESPWPADAAGAGQSLQRTAPAAFGGLVTSWIASAPTPGALATALVGDVNHDGRVDGLDVEPFVALLIGGTYDANADMNGDGQVNGLDVGLFVTAVVGGFV